jgi:hypothetical protein
MGDEYEQLPARRSGLEEVTDCGQVGFAVLRTLIEGIEARQLGDRPQVQQLGRFQAAAPLARVDPRALDAPVPQPIADGPSLLTAAVAQVTLGRTVAETKTLRVSSSRCRGVADEEDLTTCEHALDKVVIPGPGGRRCAQSRKEEDQPTERLP